jgi:DNA-binding NtrC family response regulator
MNKKPILIVDDNAGFRKTLSDILTAKGYVPMISSKPKRICERAKKNTESFWKPHRKDSGC